MKNHRRLLSSFMFAAVFFQAPSSRALDIVFDPAHTLETVAQVTQLAEQIEQLYNQITLAETHLSRITGVRGMESLLSSVYDNEIDSVLADIEGIMRITNLLEANNALSPPEQRFTRTQELENDLWNQESRLAAKWQAQTDKYLDSTVNRFTEIKKLITKLTGTPEQKDILDLQARAQSENSMLLNEQAKIRMVMAQLEAEEKVLARRRMQAAVQDSSGDVNYDGLFDDIAWDDIFAVE